MCEGGKEAAERRQEEEQENGRAQSKPTTIHKDVREKTRCRTQKQKVKHFLFCNNFVSAINFAIQIP